MIADVWCEHTSYEMDLEEEETRDMDLNVINTAEMNVICAEAMAPSSKGKVPLYYMVSLQVVYFMVLNLINAVPSVMKQSQFLVHIEIFFLISLLCY